MGATHSCSRSFLSWPAILHACCWRGSKLPSVKTRFHIIAALTTCLLAQRLSPQHSLLTRLHSGGSAIFVLAENSRSAAGIESCHLLCVGAFCCQHEISRHRSVHVKYSHIICSKTIGSRWIHHWSFGLLICDRFLGSWGWCFWILGYGRILGVNSLRLTSHFTCLLTMVFICDTFECVICISGYFDHLCQLTS